MSDEMLTISKENSTYNINCNTLNLGYFNIGMIESIPNNILDNIITSIPQKKLGDAKDIFEGVNFIFKCSYLTGAEININGGLY
jgi:acetoacetyl-CoA reductase/3-oxoacyl-[acyl-carrier protein] reductase